MNDQQTDRNHRRSLRNLLLHPNLQIRLAAYYLLLTLAFAGALAWLTYARMREFVGVVIDLTEVPEEVWAVAGGYLTTLGWTFVVALAVFAAIAIAVTVLYTHRLVGPATAFERHIRQLEQGQYDQRVHLRTGDAFDHVADALNDLTAKLQESDKGG